MLFCSLIKGITPKIHVFCFVLINNVLLNLFCIWILLCILKLFYPSSLAFFVWFVTICLAYMCTQFAGYFSKPWLYEMICVVYWNDLYGLHAHLPCFVAVKLNMNEWMNENLYIAHKKLPHKTLRVHSARYTQCIHVSSCKLKLPKDMHSYPPIPFQKWNYA